MSIEVGRPALAMAVSLLMSSHAWSQAAGQGGVLEPAAQAKTALPTVNVASGKPDAGAHVSSVTILNEGSDSNGPIHIAYSDGTIVTISKGTKANRPDDQQVGFQGAKRADDKRTVGWAETIAWCCASYPLPHVLDVYRDGRFLLHIEVQSMIYTYMFSQNAAQVAVLWGFPHGSTPFYYELYDLGSGRKAAEIGAFPDETHKSDAPRLGKDAPMWAKALERAWLHDESN